MDTVTLSGFAVDTVVDVDRVSVGSTAQLAANSLTVDAFSQRVNIGIGAGPTGTVSEINFTYTDTSDELRDFLGDGTTLSIFHYFNYDLRSLSQTQLVISLMEAL